MNQRISFAPRWETSLRGNRSRLCGPHTENWLRPSGAKSTAHKGIGSGLGSLREPRLFPTPDWGSLGSALRQRRSAERSESLRRALLEHKEGTPGLGPFFVKKESSHSIIIYYY